MEAIDPNIYEGEARMVAFRTTQERILPWLKTLNIFYFEFYGKQTDKEISWVDSPQSRSLNQTLQSVTIDIKSKEGKLMYKVTFFLRSGLIQCQGSCHEQYMHNDFPQLLELVKKITGSTLSEKPAEHDQQKVDTAIKQSSCPNDQQETDTLPKQSSYSHKHLPETEQTEPKKTFAEKDENDSITENWNRLQLGLKRAIESFQDNNSVKTSEIPTAIQKCNDSINKIPDKIKQIAGHRETETALSTEMSTLKSKIKTLEEQNSALTS
jgi:hypothetical protein